MMTGEETTFISVILAAGVELMCLEWERMECKVRWYRNQREVWDGSGRRVSA